MATALLGSNGSALPNELALIVLDHLEDDYSALCQLAQTCRGLQNLAEERLYQTIELTSIKALRAIVDAFTQRPARVRAMQTLKILYQYKPKDLRDSEVMRMGFNSFLKDMVNLREWHIESPFDNFKWDKAGGDGWVEHDMERFRQYLEIACNEGPGEADRIVAEQRLGKNVDRTVGLALLERLTIHSHGINSDFWSLDGFHCLFRHPALRHLHMSCVVLPDAEIAELASHIRKSPLTTLTFDECELEPKSLLSILRTPAHLRELVLGENVYNIRKSRHVNPRLSKDVSASLEALAAVAHSLESLTHLNPGWRKDLSPHLCQSVRPAGSGMRGFHSLKYLECDTNSFLHQAIIMNRDIAPPSLETLRIRRHWDVEIDFWDQPPAMDHYVALPSLKTLDLMQSSFVWHELSQADYICESSRVRNYHSKAYRLSKANINMRMLVEMHRDPSLIPPYLHGESVPKVQCIYDASAVGFHRHIDKDLWPGTFDFDTPELHPPPKLTTGDEPETDQLGDVDIARMRGETRRALTRLKHEFLHRRARQAAMLGDLLANDEIDEEISDLDEDEDLAMDMDMEDDMDDDDFELDDEDMEFMEDDGVHLFEHNGELYITVYNSGSGSESGSESEWGTDQEGEGDDMDETPSSNQGAHATGDLLD